MTAVIEELRDGAAALSLNLQEGQLTRLGQFVDLLYKWNQTYNLTALRQKELMVSHHVLDSLSVVPYLAGVKTAADIGSGGGLPGLPLAIACPDIQFTLLDANNKKTSFLTQAVIELGLTNVKVIQARVEEVRDLVFEVIISRAFAELSDFTALTGHLLAADGRWLAMKGVYPYAELAKLPPDITVKSTAPVLIPALGAQRHIIVLAVKKDT